jgi:hypothetical protein
MSQSLVHEKATNQKKGKWKLVGYIVGGIIGCLLLLVTVGLLLILKETPPPIIETNPAAAQRLQKEVQEAQVTAANGTPAIVKADETELNSVLKEYLKGTTNKALADNPAVLRDVKVNLVADRLRLYLLANFRGKDLTFVLEGKIRTVDGYLDFEPVSGSVGSLSIPRESLTKAVTQMVATPTTKELMRLPRNLSDLHVEGGKLVVTFR